MHRPGRSLRSTGVMHLPRHAQVPIAHPLWFGLAPVPNCAQTPAGHLLVDRSLDVAASSTACQGQHQADKQLEERHRDAHQPPSVHSTRAYRMLPHYQEGRVATTPVKPPHHQIVCSLQQVVAAPIAI